MTPCSQSTLLAWTPLGDIRYARPTSDKPWRRASSGAVGIATIVPSTQVQRTEFRIVGVAAAEQDGHCPPPPGCDATSRRAWEHPGMGSRHVIENLIKLTERGHLPVDGPGGELAEAWLAHVIATTRAVVVLHDRGYGFEAAPMRRSVMEHGLWLQWLTRNREAAWSIARAKRRLSVKRNEDILAASWPERVAAILAGEELHVPTTKEIIDGMAVEELQVHPEQEPRARAWFAAFWSDSEDSHPGINTAAEHSTEARDYDSSLAVGLLLSVEAYSRLLPGDPWATNLEHAALALAYAVRVERDRWQLKSSTEGSLPPHGGST
jgi:hypothetical protein